MFHPVTPEISNLEQIASDQWLSLATAAHDRHHAWHTPTLANVGEGIAQLRTVVLRSADPDTRILSCHTDSRSPKVIQLAEDSRFSWHFYDRDAKIQLRAYGNAWTHQGDTLASQRWQDGAWRSAQCVIAHRLRRVRPARKRTWISMPRWTAQRARNTSWCWPVRSTSLTGCS